MTKKVYIETHGCQMNVHDTEKALYALSEAGYSPTKDPAGADLVLLNTCMVREKPEQKVFKRIDDLKRMGSPIVGVMGCVAQAEAERIFDRSPAVRLVLGTQAIGSLPSMLRQLESGFDRAIEVKLERDAEFFELDTASRRGDHVAFISIIEGCNKFCSYCIVPFTRGRERSRPAAAILDEARALADSGVKEIQLLGQNVNSYGLSGRYRGSIPVKGAGRGEEGDLTFAGLLELLATESGVPRIKYTTSYPRDFDSEVVRVMDSHESLCEWIHLPAQSGSDRVLKMMRRGYTLSDYMKKIEAIRSAKKDYSITGDIIVGFPGETEDDFRATIEMVENVGYDGLFIFKYSQRPNTAASAYEDSIPDELKTERLMILGEIQARQQQLRYGRHLGKTLEVLVEGESAKSDEYYSGHSRCQKTVNFPKGESRPGDIVDVLIEHAGRNSLRGRIVGIKGRQVAGN